MVGTKFHLEKLVIIIVRTKTGVMENIYKAYTRKIDGVNFYFVKKYTAFPEYENSPNVLDRMGMHSDFYKACDIAKVYDESIVARLMNDLHIFRESDRFIHIHRTESITHSLIKNTRQAILKLKWAITN